MVEAELYTHAQPPTANLDTGRSASTRAEFRRLTRETVFTDNVVRVPLLVCSQVAMGQVVVGQALVSHESGAFENRQSETWKSTHVDLVGRQTRHRADRIVVSQHDVREVQIPVVLPFVDYHSQDLGHSVVHPLNASDAVGMIGACGKLAHSQQLAYSLGKLRSGLKAVVREYVARSPP